MSNRFPKKCPRCSSPWYEGFNSIECSNSRCPEPAESRLEITGTQAYTLATKYLNGAIAQAWQQAGIAHAAAPILNVVPAPTVAPVAVGQKYTNVFHGINWEVHKPSLFTPGIWSLTCLCSGNCGVVDAVSESDLQDPKKWTLVPSGGQPVRFIDTLQVGDQFEHLLGLNKPFDIYTVMHIDYVMNEVELQKGARPPSFTYPADMLGDPTLFRKI